MSTEDNATMVASIKKFGWDVPSFDCHVIRERHSDYVIIIPVINEGLRIRHQLNTMLQQGLTAAYDIVLVDGGSTDGSLELTLLQEMGLRALLTKTGPGRLSAQLRCGYAWALLEGYSGVITIDGNGKDGVETVPQFAAALDSGIDYAQASRFIKGGIAENTPLSRYLAIRFIHAPVLSLAARYWFTDTTQGYRAYSRRYLLDGRTQPFRPVFQGYELLAYLTVRATQLGYRATEIATRRTYPSNEEIPTKIAGIHALSNLLSVMLKAALGLYAPQGRNSDDT